MMPPMRLRFGAGNGNAKGKAMGNSKKVKIEVRTRVHVVTFVFEFALVSIILQELSSIRFDDSSVSISVWIYEGASLACFVTISLLYLETII